MRLSDMTIRALKAPAKGAQIHYDDIVPGFGVRVSQQGTKSFVLTHGRRRHRETIGRVGILPLQEARGEAKRRLAEFTLGKQKPRSMTWKGGVREFLEEVEARCKPRTHTDYERLLARFPFGETPLSEIAQGDLERDLAKMKKHPAEQQHAFVVLRVFVNWAHQKHYVDRSPMERMKPLHRYKPRERVLTDQELVKVWNATGDGPFGAIVKLLILTGQRKGEISNLTAGMIGDGTITLPSWLTKNSREHTFPIGLISKSLLPKSLHRDDPHRFLFPAKTSNQLQTPFNGFSKSKFVLDKRSGVSNWTLHDLRRTFASGLAAQGVSLPVIERILNHVSGSFGGIVGVYQRYDFFPEMKAAVEKWEGHLLTLLKT